MKHPVADFARIRDRNALVPITAMCFSRAHQEIKRVGIPSDLALHPVSES
jgi:hypothetical protein